MFPTREDIHLLESKKRAQLSDNFKEVAKSNQLLSKIKLKSTEDLKYYEGYQTSLVCNQNDSQIQDLLVHSSSKEKRLQKLQELKKAKVLLLEEEMQLEAKRLKEAKLKAK